MPLISSQPDVYLSFIIMSVAYWSVCLIKWDVNEFRILIATDTSIQACVYDSHNTDTNVSKTMLVSTRIMLLSK